MSFNRNRFSSYPTLLVNPSTQQLLADVFEAGDNLFSDLPIIRKRIVLWGNQPPLSLPHSGIVVNEADLLERLWSRVNAPNTRGLAQPDFTIHSTLRTRNIDQQHFGSRVAKSVPVIIKETASDACWVESLDAGWLFLLPVTERTGSLLAVGESAAKLLGQSRLIDRQIDSILDNVVEFPAYPRVLNPLCAPGWLACGSAAMGFDPICGEGVGNAVREAILASAVVENLASRQNSEGALSHYSSRLLSGFLRHLDVCRRFYLSARGAAWWDAELAALERGIAWTQSQLCAFPQPKFRLLGFNLEPLS